MRQHRREWLWGVAGFLLFMGTLGWGVYFFEQLSLRSQWQSRAALLQDRLERRLADMQLQLGVVAQSLISNQTLEQGASPDEWQSVDDNELLKRLNVAEVIVHSPQSSRRIYGQGGYSQAQPWRASVYDFLRTQTTQCALELTAAGARVLDIEPIRQADRVWGLEVSVDLQSFIEDFSRREGVNVAFVVPYERWHSSVSTSFSDSQGRRWVVLATSGQGVEKILSSGGLSGYLGRGALGVQTEGSVKYGVVLTGNYEYQSADVPLVGAGSSLVIWSDVTQAWAQAKGDFRASLAWIWLGVGGVGGVLGYFALRYRQRARAKYRAATQALELSVANLKTEAWVRQMSEERMRHMLALAHQQRLQDRERVARLAHELKLSASSTIGFAQLIQTAALAAEREELAQNLSQTGSDLFSLGENVELWALSEHLATRLLPEECKVAQVLAEVVSVLEPYARRKAVTFDISVDPQVQIRVDVGLWKLCVKNVMHNAIKYSLPGSVVGVAVRELSGGVELTVADSGMGIPRDIMEHLFEPGFAKVRRGTMAEEGAGLGLELAQAIMQAHGGDVRVASEETSGCRVSLLWPRSNAGAKPRKV